MPCLLEVFLVKDRDGDLVIHFLEHGVAVELQQVESLRLGYRHLSELGRGWSLVHDAPKHE